MLNPHHRNIVRDAIVKHCQIRQWRLFGLHVRTTHVHCVVQADKPIDQTMKEFKSWATRMLQKNGLTNPQIWTEGASCNYIFTTAKLLEKVHYVVYEQGEKMECYLDDALKLQQ